MTGIWEISYSDTANEVSRAKLALGRFPASRNAVLSRNSFAEFPPPSRLKVYRQSARLALIVAIEITDVEVFV
jgi:hypothetical protein